MEQRTTAGRGIEVEQIDPVTNEVVRVYPSFLEASKVNGLRYQQIQRAINERLMLGGYRWRRVVQEPAPKAAKPAPRTALPPRVSDEDFIREALARVRAQE